jgi:uncharacterized paraquat-inducible protein A
VIELSPTTALMLYLGFTLTILLGAWLYSHYSSRHKKILPLEQELHICEFCHFAYLDTNAKKITRCPRCQSFNNI